MEESNKKKKGHGGVNVAVGSNIGEGLSEKKNLQSENKVVECSILQPKDLIQTASKETQIN
jgi:hypothetical protein